MQSEVQKSPSEKKARLNVSRQSLETRAAAGREETA